MRSATPIPARQADPTGVAQFGERERERLLTVGARERERECRAPAGPVAHAQLVYRLPALAEIVDRPGVVSSKQSQTATDLAQPGAGEGRGQVRIELERLRERRDILERRALQERIDSEPQRDRLGQAVVLVREVEPGAQVGLGADEVSAARQHPCSEDDSLYEAVHRAACSRVA